MDRPHQVSEVRARGEIVAVRFDGLSEQRHFLHAARAVVLHFVADVLDRPALLASAPVRDDAVRAELVAAVDHRHERRRRIRLAKGRRPELAAGVLDSGQLHDRREVLRPRERIHVREAALKIVVPRPDHAPHHGDAEVFAARTQLLQPPQLPDRAVLRVLAHRARVQHDEVSVIWRLDGRAARAIQPRRELPRVRHVHLTADGPNVIFQLVHPAAPSATA